MSSAEARRRSAVPSRGVEQYLEPTILGQPIINTQDWLNLAQQLDPTTYQEMENADQFGIDIGYEDVSNAINTILGPTDFFDPYYTITEYRNINRSQVLQRTVPVFQVAVKAVLHPQGVLHYLNPQQYIYTLFREVCARQGIDPLGEGYCQIRVEPFENMWNENKTQTYQHGFATTMVPLQDMEVAIENILNSIAQSENALELEDMEDVEIQYYFTFVLTRSSEDITANVVTEATRLHHLRDRHKITRRGQDRAMLRFAMLEEHRNEQRGLLRNQERSVTPQVLENIRQRVPIVHAMMQEERARRHRTMGRIEEEMGRRVRRRNNAAQFAEQQQIQGAIDGDLQFVVDAFADQPTRLQRWYNAMTPEQRAERRRRYNRTQRAKNNTVRGIYEEYRKRLFHHQSVEEFFTYSKAILQVTNTYDQGYCLAMAFIRSQCCSIDIATGQVTESKPIPHVRSDDELHWLKTVEVLPAYKTSFPRAYSFTKDANVDG